MKKKSDVREKELTAAKPNFLIEARLRFKGDIHAHRLFTLMLATIYDGANANNPFEVDAATIIGRDLDGGAAYDVIKQACRNILGEIVDLLEGCGRKAFKFRNLVTAAEYDEKGSGKIRVQFHPDVAPYVEAIFAEGRYTKIFLKYSMPIRSLYSVRIYELLLQYKNIGQRDIKLEDFRHFLDIPNGKFELFGNIKARIIEPAQKHLEELTNIKFEYETLHEGSKKVVGIRFFIFDNQPTKGLNFDKAKIAASSKPPETPSKHVQIIREHLYPKSQEEALQRFPATYIEHYFAAAKQAESEGRVKKNFQGFFWALLNEDPEDYEKIVARKAKKTNKQPEAILKAQKEEAEKLQAEAIKQAEFKAYEIELEKMLEPFRSLPPSIKEKYYDLVSPAIKGELRECAAAEMYAKESQQQPKYKPAPLTAALLKNPKKSPLDKFKNLFS